MSPEFGTCIVCCIMMTIVFVTARIEVHYLRKKCEIMAEIIEELHRELEDNVSE